MDNKDRAGGGITFVGMLTIVFVVLKLLNLVQWSWLWVLAPMWMSVALGVIVLIISLIVAITVHRFTGV